MPRDSYYQSVENPTQFHLLPDWMPKLQFLYRPQEDCEKLGVLYSGSGLLLIMVILACCLVVQSVLPMATFLLSVLVLVWFVVVSVTEIVEGNPVWPNAAVMFTATSLWVQLNFVLPIGLSALLSSIALGAFAYAFATHWVYLCTTSPLDRETSERVRADSHRQLAVVCCLPVVIVVIAIAAGNVTLSLLGIPAVAVILGIPLAFDKKRIFRMGAFVDAARLWFTYQSIPLPGIARSPIGGQSERSTMTACCVMLLAAPLLISPLGAIVNLLLDYVALPDGLLPFRQQTGGPSLAVLLGIVPTRVVGICLDLFMSVTMPLFFLNASTLVLTFLTLSEAEAYAQGEVTAENWPALIHDIQSSEDTVERGSIYVGRNVHDGSPVLVPRGVYNEHAHFLGDSGSGKTSMGLIPLVEQLIAGEDCSVVMIDHKADTHELLATLTTAAEQRQRRTGNELPIKFFSNEFDRPTFAFNPLAQQFLRDMPLFPKTDILCAALGLDYGAEYGESYYSSTNAAVFYETLKRHPDISSLAEAAQRVRHLLIHSGRKELLPKTRDAGDHVCTVLERLGCVDALNVAPSGIGSRQVVDEAIDLSSAFSTPQLHYFHLPYTFSPRTSPEIGRLVAWSLLLAAAKAKRKHRVYLVIDEFQRMVANNLAAMLQLARSMDISVILANQSMQDLRTGKTDLISAVESNCRVRQSFATSLMEDRERLTKNGGETVEGFNNFSHTISENGSSTTQSLNEHLFPRASTNDLLLASDHPRHSIFRLTRGSGYAQFGGFSFVLESDYHITLDEYERRKAMPWPTEVLGTYVPSKAQTDAPNINVVSGPHVTTEIVGEAILQKAPSKEPSKPTAFKPNKKRRTKKKPRRNEGNQ